MQSQKLKKVVGSVEPGNRRLESKGASTSRPPPPRPLKRSDIPKPLPPQPRSPRSTVTMRNSRRKELRRLHEQIELLQAELKQLSTAPPASQVCREIEQYMDQVPDPFVGNNQPGAASSDRWFADPVQQKNPCCCFLV